MSVVQTGFPTNSQPVQLDAIVKLSANEEWRHGYSTIMQMSLYSQDSERGLPSVVAGNAASAHHTEINCSGSFYRYSGFLPGGLHQIVQMTRMTRRKQVQPKRMKCKWIYSIMFVFTVDTRSVNIKGTGRSAAFPCTVRDLHNPQMTDTRFP